MNSPDKRKPAILIAEDDPDDRLLLEVVSRRLEDSCEFRFVEDGGELMEYLHCRGVYANSKPPRPELILLDLNMPKKDGREALVEIKQNDYLKTIPIIVWTTSTMEEDIRLCNEAGAEGYITKPSNFADLNAAIKNIVNVWLHLPQSANSDRLKNRAD